MARAFPLLALLASCTGELSDRPFDLGTRDVSTADAAADGSRTDMNVGDAFVDLGEGDLAAGDARTDAPLDGGEGGLVPVFIAVADGGWTAISCDHGATWRATQFSEERDDHSEWTAFGGLATDGEGNFAIGLGWGAPGHVLSANATLEWNDLPASAFEREDDRGLDGSVGGLAFDGREFVLFSRQVWRSSDGATWQITERQLPPASHQLRQLRAFPAEGLLVASLEAQRENDHRPVGNFIALSEDGGESWYEGAGYDGECSRPIQHRGDIAMVGDVLLVGAEAFCRSTDRGRTWSRTESPFDGQAGGVFNDDTSFYALASRYSRSGALMRSDDGTSWSEVADLETEVSVGTYGAGTYVLASRGTEQPRFFFSEDAREWREGELLDDLGEVRIRNLEFGYADCGM